MDRPKRPRVEEAEPLADESSMALDELLKNQQWPQVAQFAAKHPREVQAMIDPTPLAIACRMGAGIECISALLEAAPEHIRRVLDSRGTPLHEAIVCELTGVQVIDSLLKADEALGDGRRATLLQDVDGFTPLHLLIRRRFQSHILRSDSDNSLMKILELLVVSCPEAVVIPDRGEYEEPPIVYALKANIYAPSLGSEDATLSRVELKIYEMVACMLKYYPDAASRVFTGYRGQYTALHSAVFHGRHTNTIELLLQADAARRSSLSSVQPALLGNTQGEIPLHFCTMRGERPRSIALIAKAAPQAVLQRDASGLTPFHWLWIRFVGTLLALDDTGRGVSETTMPIDHRRSLFEKNRYNDFANFEQADFDLDLQLFKRMDPPVDFLRMRHIPTEVQSDERHWADRSVSILQRIREAYRTSSSSMVWNRQEVVTGHFWNKVVSLLEAAQIAGEDAPFGSSVLVHAAFATSCCVPAVARIVACLFPEELSIRDNRGRLPIHYAACRPWQAWDWPRDDGLNEPTAASLLQHESLRMLRTAMDVSSPKALQVVDHDGRLVLHHAIDTFVQACCRPSRTTSNRLVQEMLQVLADLVKLNPEALQQRDGRSKLYPFLQATAMASEQTQPHVPDELPLSITFQLLRDNPALLSDAR